MVNRSAGNPPESIDQERDVLEAQARALPFQHVILASTAQARGGVWRHIKDLGLGLQGLGLGVTIGLHPQAGSLQEAAEGAGLRWRPLRQTLRERSAIWHVHLHNTYDPLAFAALAARRLAGPAVITEHLPRNHASDSRLESHHRRRPGAFTAKTIFKRAEYRVTNIVIAVGSSSAAFLRERYAPLPTAITVVHNGIDVADGPAVPNVLNGPMHVLALGSLGRQKGFDVLLEAVSRSNSDWRLTIAGDGYQLGNLRAMSASLPPGRVTFPGWVDDAHLLVQQANVICMPSRWESFPYAALEALALSRPVVGTRVDGLDEIVEDGVCGFLVEPNRPEQLASALDRISADPELLAQLAVAGRTRAERFTIPAMLAGTLAAYDVACEQRSRPRRDRRDR